MLKYYEDYSSCLNDGKEFAKKYNVRVYSISLWTPERPKLWVLLSCSSLHLIPGGYDAACDNLGSWYFGCASKLTVEERKKYSDLQEVEPLPGKLEYWYEMVASYSRNPQENIIKIAEIAERENCGVWHACSVFYNSTDCICAKCVKGRAN